MTADAAHVAAAVEALVTSSPNRGWMGVSLDGRPSTAHLLATVAVETLTPLIRAQVAAEIRAAARDHARVVGDTRGAPATNNPIQRARDEGIQIAYARALLIAEGTP